MRQEHFVERHQREWLEFESWLEARARKRGQPDTDWRGLRDDEMPGAYRRLCQQLSLARRRGYSPHLVARLQALVQRGHNALYRPPLPQWRRMFEFFLADFPALVRAERGAMLASLLLFAGSLLAVFFGVLAKPELAHTLFDPQQLAGFERMYDPAAPKLGRESGEDLAMFGYYIFNNIGIGLRTFASGLLAGIGPVLTLAFNGAIIGGVAGHLQAVGHGDPFWRFVCGHGAFELTAIVIAGGAGLRLGLDVLAPGRRSRVDALIEGGRRGAKLSLGVFFMLVVAAFIEAFWSSIASIPAGVKFGVAGALWALVLLWLWRGGVDRHAA